MKSHPVSTKTGDHGESGLANGQRLGKDEFIFEVLGTQDELNSWLGLIIAKLPERFEKHKKFLLEIQDNLFYVGAEVARSPKAKLSEEALTNLERESDTLQEIMGDGWTTKFIYPGGNEAAAITDIARAVSRRFERVIIRYNKMDEKVSPLILQYINRLSDYLFVLRCFINHEEKYQEKRFESDKAYVNRIKL